MLHKERDIDCKRTIVKENIYYTMEIDLYPIQFRLLRLFFLHFNKLHEKRNQNTTLLEQFQNQI
jgi:uncharacterized membrane protein YgaE (UPF0421/DUF939 family)